MLNIRNLRALIAVLVIAVAPVTAAQGQTFKERIDVLTENLSNYTNWFTVQKVENFTVETVEYDLDVNGRFVQLTARFSFRPERDGKVSPLAAHLQCGDAQDARAETLETLTFDNAWKVHTKAGTVPVQTDNHLVTGGTTNTYSVTYRPVAGAQVEPEGALCFLDLPIRLEHLDGLETASAVFDPARCKPKANFGSTRECKGIQNEPSRYWFRAIEVHKSKDFKWNGPDDDIHPINIECVGREICTYAFRNIDRVDLIMVRGRCLRGAGGEKVLYFKTEEIGPHNLVFDCG